MTQAPQLIEIGDVVRLTGEASPPTFLVVRELLPDGEHALCVKAESKTVGYVLALKDLVKDGCVGEGWGEGYSQP